MSDVWIERDPDGLRLIVDHLRALGPALDEELDQLAKERTYAIRDAAKTYDAAPVPTYHRTEHMSRQTVAMRNREGPGWVAEMRASYSVYVRGSMSLPQAYMHKGRWRTWVDIVETAVTGLQQEAAALLERAKRRAGW